jgi:hypothetical protein
MNWESILASVTPALLALAYLIAAKYSVEVVTFAASKIADLILSLQAKVNENKIAAMVTIDDMIFQHGSAAVAATKDMLVDRLKEASSDGKLTKEEMQECIEAAYQTMIASLTGPQLALLKDALGADLKKIITARIPSIVAAVKASGLLGAQAPAAPAADTVEGEDSFK